MNQRPPSRRAEAKESVRLAENTGNDSFDLVVQAAAQLGRGRGIILNRLDILLASLGMKDVRLHRPMSLRMRADTSSPGMP